VQLNLVTGCIDASLSAEAGTPLRWLHGMLMMFSWCILLTSGVFLARYFKKAFWPWFYFHIFLQSAGILTMLASFIVIFIERGGSYTPGLHHVRSFTFKII